MESKEIAIVVGVALIVSLLVAIVSTTITGNLIRVTAKNRPWYSEPVYNISEVYNKTEIDANLESYYLDASVRRDTDAGINYTTIRNIVTGQTVCMDKRIGQSCYIGNILLTITDSSCRPEHKIVELEGTTSIGNRILFEIVRYDHKIRESRINKITFNATSSSVDENEGFIVTVLNFR